jgi:hypothetical protein
MDYEKAQYSAYANQASNAANQFGGAVGILQQGITAPPTPRTITSAASRIDILNERLLKTVEVLSQISSQLGAITPISKEANGETSPCGAVHRLNDSADRAHARLNEVDALLNSIMRTLG